MDTNTRFIEIDNDTRVGFNYIKQQYYVTNKTYTTYRKTLPLIREVLNSLDIPQDNPTDEEIEALKGHIETLYKVSYTWQDNGAYIHTLQFNDFKNYPLTIDCEKHKLYIMNSTIIYDLTLNESPRNVRIPRILSFYKNTLGLLISTEDMRYFYSLLLSYYYPTCYNQIALNTDTNKFFYNNMFLLSNYSNTSQAEYQCTYNPNNTAEYTRVAYVTSADASANTITTATPITEEDLQGYNTIILKGADTYMPETETTYTADGKYVVDTIEGNTIKVAGTIPYSYEFPFKECYVLSAQAEVIKMERESKKITLTNLPENVLVGDVILISGATITTEYETISCNGTYTVEFIQDNTITVNESIPTDFEGTATLIKEIFISNICTIRAKKLTLTNNTDLNLEGATILVHTIGDTDTTIENYTVSAYTTNTITVVEDITPYNYTSTCPQLFIPVPSPTENAEVLIDVTRVAEGIEELFPETTFMVDNFDQCKAYIGTLAGLVKPTDNVRDNLYKEIPTSIDLVEIPDLTTATEGDKIGCSVASMDFAGVYSRVYKEGESL